MIDVLQHAVPALVATTALVFLLYYVVLLTLLLSALWLGSRSARKERSRQEERAKTQAKEA